MITEVIYWGLIAYFLLTSVMVTGGVGISLLASLKLHSYEITWRTLNDFLSLVMSVLTIAMIWPLIVLFVVFLSVRYSLISMTYSP